MYILFIRSLLEQSATVWHRNLTQENCDDLERVQKSALKIILGDKYPGYEQALARLDLEKLDSRRETLCFTFAKKCTKNDMHTRNFEKYEVQFAHTERLQKSPLIYMQNLLNQEYSKTR